MERRRIVVTGIGTVNASTVGGTEAVAGALALGRSPIAPVRHFKLAEAGGSRLAAEVDDAALSSLLDRDQARRLSRICRLTLAACLLAMRDAGLQGGPGLGIVVGTEHGDFRSSEEFAAGFLRRGPAGLSPMLFPNTVMNAMASVAAIAIGAKAPSVTVNQPTIAGDLAVARAAALIASGRAQAVMAGGVDEICEPVYRRLAEMSALSPMRGGPSPGAPEGCRPFASDHNGPVLGEGATFLALEELDAARARGARILAELVGAAWGNLPAAPHTAPVARADGGSPVRRFLTSPDAPTARLARCYGAGNGDPGLDDWEIALLERDLTDAGAPAGLNPPVSLAPLFGQHGGLGALRAAAAALDAGRLPGMVLVHGVARGGCRSALVAGPPA
jgi:3-oxoacyl-[acyl-carrier-protein] synthase II